MHHVKLRCLRLGWGLKVGNSWHGVTSFKWKDDSIDRDYRLKDLKHKLNLLFSMFSLYKVQEKHLILNTLPAALGLGALLLNLGKRSKRPLKLSNWHFYINFENLSRVNNCACTYLFLSQGCKILNCSLFVTICTFVWLDHSGINISKKGFGIAIEIITTLGFLWINPTLTISQQLFFDFCTECMVSPMKTGSGFCGDLISTAARNAKTVIYKKTEVCRKVGTYLRVGKLA